MEVKIMLEQAEGMFIATTRDDIGQVARAEKTSRDEALALVKRRTRVALGMDCTFGEIIDLTAKTST